MGFLKKIGAAFSKVAHFLAGSGVQIEKVAIPVAKALLPSIAPALDKADGIFNNIVSEVVATETAVQAAGTTSGGGAQKLATVLANISPVLDGWVAAAFPGSKQVSDASKAGLVNAVVAILNEIDAPTVPTA